MPKVAVNDSKNETLPASHGLTVSMAAAASPSEFRGSACFHDALPTHSSAIMIPARITEGLKPVKAT